MENAIEKPTDKQRALLNKLMLSSTFTAEEAHRTVIFLNSPRTTKDQATEVIEKAMARIKKRDDDKKASTDRKAEYHANKDNNGGEYPPKRYSQDHPPNGGDPPNGKAPESASVPLPARKAEDETKIFVINGKEYTDPNEAAAAASKAIFG